MNRYHRASQDSEERLYLDLGLREMSIPYQKLMNQVEHGTEADSKRAAFVSTLDSNFSRAMAHQDHKKRLENSREDSSSYRAHAPQSYASYNTNPYISSVNDAPSVNGVPSVNSRTAFAAPVQGVGHTGMSSSIYTLGPNSRLLPSNSVALPLNSVAPFSQTHSVAHRDTHRDTHRDSHRDTERDTHRETNPSQMGMQRDMQTDTRRRMSGISVRSSKTRMTAAAAASTPTYSVGLPEAPPSTTYAAFPEVPSIHQSSGPRSSAHFGTSIAVVNGRQEYVDANDDARSGSTGAPHIVRRRQRRRQKHGKDAAQKKNPNYCSCC